MLMKPVISVVAAFCIAVLAIARVEAAMKAASLDLARTHWSFQSISNPVPPTVRKASWPRQDLDRFVLARLEHEQLKPNPPAEPRALIRRVYFDLIGLPPSFEEVEKFAAKPTRENFARLVDDLLARPEYGQRWARHWLDVARYADTIEQSVDGERRIPFAHTYRDYVVDALNSDKPFDRFVLEQIAADRLPDATPADLRALGIFGIGRQFFANADGPALRVDDRIDTISRGFLGLTLACARCHDHKFDPIPTADYYSLYGILDSLEAPIDLPEVRRSGDAKALAEFEKKRSKAIADYEAHVDATFASSSKHLRDFAMEYLQYLVRASPNHRTTDGDIPLDTPRGWLVYHAPDRWAALLKQCQQRDEPFFRLWHPLMALPKKDFAAAAKRIIDLGLANHHPAVVAAFKESPPQTMLDAATTYGGIIAQALKSDTPESRAIVELIFGKGSPVPPASRDEIRADLHRFLNEKELVNRSDGEKAGKLLTDIHVIDISGPVDRAMAVKPTPKPVDPRVFIRGDMKQPGAAVPRKFLSVLGGVDSRSYADDGRLQLAQAIASTKNPLTARVIVNRVWQQHFGTGLVATPDDFGTMGQRPSHPELLDHLATWFTEHGWSLKALHRYILNSATWQQSSAVQSRAQTKAPSNHLLWRVSPRRLEFEPLRDSMLHVAGRLDTRLGGRGAMLDDKNTRRALYGYTDRFRIPALLRNFDVANPDTSISRRAETLVPLQALYLMNSSFVRTQAEAVLHRPAIEKAKSARERVAATFRSVLSRQPSKDEMKLALNYVGDASLDESGAQRWASFVQGLLVSNEFIFVD